MSDAGLLGSSDGGDTWKTVSGGPLSKCCYFPSQELLDSLENPESLSAIRKQELKTKIKAVTALLKKAVKGLEELSIDIQ